MIGFTKLLCGTASVSDIVKYGSRQEKLPPHMLQFSSANTPILVWNVTARCNLSCRHCYIDAVQNSSGELTTEQALALIQDLAKMKVPVLLFSGGEPLLREDLLLLARAASTAGLRPVLSTNGTLITPAIAASLAAAGFAYVGVSIDGTEEVHDRFRGQPGAFRAALAGLRYARSAGCRTGIRFTLNANNLESLPFVLNLAVEEQIPRFCMYHLVYAGRGRGLSNQDTTLEQKRAVVRLLMERAHEYHRRGIDIEILTTDNHADGLWILDYIREHQPERLEEVRSLLAMHGGCSAGQKMANIDPEGNVHPCQFWRHVTLGNIKERPFSEIWSQPAGLLGRLRDKASHLTGRCGECADKALCAGCRIRAEFDGDLWGTDPACYLSQRSARS